MLGYLLMQVLLPIQNKKRGKFEVVEVLTNTRVINIDVLSFTGVMENKGSFGHAESSQDRCEEKKARKVTLGAYVQCMTKIIKPDLPPGEFRCRTCNTMWSSYTRKSILCTDITERHGLHNFDFETHNLIIISFCELEAPFFTQSNLSKIVTDKVAYERYNGRYLGYYPHRSKIDLFTM